MEIHIEQQGVVTVVSIEGSIDSLTAGALQEQLQACVDQGQVQLVANFAAVEYTSSAGLRALLATVKKARTDGGDLRLAQVQPSVHKVLDLSGFTSILKLFDDVGAAVSSYV